MIKNLLTALGGAITLVLGIALIYNYPYFFGISVALVLVVALVMQRGMRINKRK